MNISDGFQLHYAFEDEKQIPKSDEDFHNYEVMLQEIIDIISSKIEVLSEILFKAIDELNVLIGLKEENEYKESLRKWVKSISDNPDCPRIITMPICYVRAINKELFRRFNIW